MNEREEYIEDETGEKDVPGCNLFAHACSPVFLETKQLLKINDRREKVQ